MTDPIFLTHPSTDCIRPFMTSASDHHRPPLTTTAVVKLGGSLLDLPDLAQRLDQLRPEWGARPLVVVGGGGAADLVRAWDQLHELGEERSHWLALDALALTARLLATLWPVACVTLREDYERAWSHGQVPIVSAREWFEVAYRQGTPTPPHTWETTTDTIAAWIAAQTQPQSLWLLKSVPCPASLAIATQLDLVDPLFAEWTPAGIPIHWVNLRNEAWPQSGEPRGASRGFL